MCSAVDRTSDFLQSVQLSHTNVKPFQSNGSFEFTTKAEHRFAPIKPTPEETMLSPSNLTAASFSHRSSSTTTGATGKRQAALQARSEFMQMAASISHDLAHTFGKLEKLNNLTRHQSLFDDHSAEIQHLSYIVKEDMADLNHRIATLQSMSKSQPTKGKQQANHSHSVLVGLQTRLASMSNQFRGLLEQRSASLRNQAARRGKYTNLSSRDSDLSFRTNAASLGPGAGVRSQNVIIPSVLLGDDEAQSHERNGTSDSSPLLDDGSKGLRLTQQLALADQTEAYLTSRADTMRTIEHTIVELGEIFQQLATMVHEQDESIQRIDTNVDDAAVSIEAGHSELVKYLRSISSNRWLMIKVFGVLFIFFIIFVVFFV